MRTVVGSSSSRKRTPLPRRAKKKPGVLLSSFQLVDPVPDIVDRIVRELSSYEEPLQSVSVSSNQQASNTGCGAQLTSPSLELLPESDTGPTQQPQQSHDEPISSANQSSKPKKKREGPYRGPSRALKYKKARLAQPEKLEILVPDELRAPVGEHALQFIGECGDWVKQYCPLNVKNWSKMPKSALAQLYGTIRANYEFVPPHHADKVMHIQCCNLFRRWRERLKKKYFNGKSLEEAACACPQYIDKEQWRWLVYSYWGSAREKEKSEVNRESAKAKKIFSASGAKSIARVIYETEVDTDSDETEEPEPESECGAVPSPSTSSLNVQPFYIKLWDRTKRHKDGCFDEEAENKMKELQKLHEKVIQEEGADNLTVEEAFEQVLGYRPGYARGLGKGHHVSRKKGKKREATEMEHEIQSLTRRERELKTEIERLQKDAEKKEEEALEKERKREEEAQRFAQRECELEAEIERLRKDAERKEAEALERERKREEDAQALVGRLRAEMESKIQDIVREHLFKF